LLKELAGWQEVSADVMGRLRARYLRQQRRLEVELGLRPPPLSPEEARDAVRERWRLRQLLYFIAQWSERGWIRPYGADELISQSQERVEELEARLGDPDTPPTPSFDVYTDSAPLLKSLQDDVDRMRQDGVWMDESAYKAAVADLERRVE
jgi:hypothetical protein